MTQNKLASAKMDHVVNDWPEAWWLWVKYNLEIDGKVASGCTIPVTTISGSMTFSHRRCAGDPVFRKYMSVASLAFLAASHCTDEVADSSLSLVGTTIAEEAV